MNETAISLALVGRLLRTRWPVFVAIALLGALCGYGSSFVLSPGYSSTSKVLLSGDRDPKQLPSEVQIATSVIVLDKVAAATGGDVTGRELQDRVSAGVDGNVISLNATGATPDDAQRLASRLTDAYIGFSAQIVDETASATAEQTKKGRTAVQARIDEANAKITSLQGTPAATASGAEGDQTRSAIEQAKSAVVQGTKELEQLDAAAADASLAASVGSTTTRIIEPAVLPTQEASPTSWQLAGVGAVIAILLVMFAHLFALRADRRLRTTQDIAAALGAPVVGRVDVVVPAGVRRSLLHRLIHDERKWAYAEAEVDEDGRGRGARYERILRRIHATGASAELMVLTMDDDPPAAAAVADLAAAAAAGGPVAVITQDDAMTGLVRSAAAALGVGNLVTAGTDVTGAGARTVLRTHVTSPSRPEVPDHLDATATVLSISAGSRIGWELADVAGACIEAGQPLTAAILVIPRQSRAGRAKEAATAADGIQDKALAGLK